MAGPRRRLLSPEALVLACLLLGGGLIGFIYLSPQGRGSHSDRKLALSEINTIEQALDEYWLAENAYPDKLEVLVATTGADGEKKYLKNPQSITDPWGRLYGYDPDAVGPQGVNRPRIWCQSPKGAGIANYEVGD